MPFNDQLPVIVPAVPTAPVVSVIDFSVPVLASIVPLPSVRLLVVPILKLPISVPTVPAPPVVNVSEVT